MKTPPPPLPSAFLVALDEPSRVAVADLGGLLDAMLVAAQVAWPDLGLADDAFYEALATRFARRRTSTPASEWLQRCKPNDLALACACERGTAAALEAFERTHGTTLRAIAQRFASDTHAVDDLLQSLREHLFVAAAAGRTPRIATYSGQGGLKAWLRVTATRLFIDRTRAQQPHDKNAVASEELEGALESAAPGDFELDFLKQTYRKEFKAAFEAAIRSLDSTSRNLLRLAYLQGLNVDQIGAIRRVHRATAARQVEKARVLLREAIRREMTERLRVGDDELRSILGLIESRVELSLHRLLRSTQVLAPSEEDPLER
ncbi:MAG: hypothetical protein AUK47_28820 [Deltaproteobacteria bacterium CG2_30_63_29]|nr:MAG: hypothetical protein AUK47_28820 [Deltaproteobacteria bacterium CG2_30_63_29]PJB35420.1 MAG: hypothetical protein CO108_25815 [Deltaproteobacteria bacterium CG_4_9_14_3_um_filter_63_12]